MEVRPDQGPPQSGSVFLFETTLQPGPLGLGQGSVRGLGLHQLLLHRAVRRRHRERTPPSRPAARPRTPTSFTSPTGRRRRRRKGRQGQIDGHNVIPIDVAVSEGILFLVPEPKSPRLRRHARRQIHHRLRQARHAHHGVFLEKIQKAIAEKKFEGKDPYGIPIIAMKDALHQIVEMDLDLSARSTIPRLARPTPRSTSTRRL